MCFTISKPTQDTKRGDTSFKHVRNLVFVNQFCALREDDPIWMWTAGSVVRGSTDPVGDLISYTFKSRPCADRIVAIAHNDKVFDLHIEINRLVRMKSWANSSS